MSICSYVHNNAMFCKCQVEVAIYVFNSRQPPSKKRLCNPAQLRRANPTPIRWIAQSFLVRRCTVIEIGKVTEDSFCWRLMYLHIQLIQCCRYLCGNCCICTGLIFAVADAFFETDVSATYFSLNLQILFSLSVMYNCIYILLFLCLADILQ